MDYKLFDNIKIVKCSNKREDSTDIEIIEANIGNVFEIFDIDNNDEELLIKIFIPGYSHKYFWLSTDEFEIMSKDLVKA